MRRRLGHDRLVQMGVSKDSGRLAPPSAAIVARGTRPQFEVHADRPLFRSREGMRQRSIARRSPCHLLAESGLVAYFVVGAPVCHAESDSPSRQVR